MSNKTDLLYDYVCREQLERGFKMPLFYNLVVFPAIWIFITFSPDDSPIRHCKNITFYAHLLNISQTLQRRNSKDNGGNFKTTTIRSSEIDHTFCLDIPIQPNAFLDSNWHYNQGKFTFISYAILTLYLLDEIRNDYNCLRVLLAFGRHSMT